MNFDKTLGKSEVNLLVKCILGSYYKHFEAGILRHTPSNFSKVLGKSWRNMHINAVLGPHKVHFKCRN